MKTIAAAIIALSTLVGIQTAGACEEDTIETVSDSGDILIMLSGATYQVNSGDEVDSQLWLTTDAVIICDDTMINKDENGEEVSVTRIR